MKIRGAGLPERRDVIAAARIVSKLQFPRPRGNALSDRLDRIEKHGPARRAFARAKIVSLLGHVHPASEADRRLQGGANGWRISLGYIQYTLTSLRVAWHGACNRKGNTQKRKLP